jgi:transposase
MVEEWIGAHNEQVKAQGKGVRILACPLPKKSPWLNPIEPKWVHGKRKVAEPDGLLDAAELERRVCACFGCEQHDHLSIPEKAA